MNFNVFSTRYAHIKYIPKYEVKLRIVIRQRTKVRRRHFQREWSEKRSIELKWLKVRKSTVILYYRTLNTGSNVSKKKFRYERSTAISVFTIILWVRDMQNCWYPRSTPMSSTVKQYNS